VECLIDLLLATAFPRRGRQLRRWSQAIGIKIEVAAKADPAPPRDVVLVAHVFERQCLDDAEQILLFGWGQKFGFVDPTLHGAGRPRAEEFTLHHSQES